MVYINPGLPGKRRIIPMKKSLSKKAKKVIEKGIEDLKRTL